jgi:hypothetical protein
MSDMIYQVRAAGVRQPQWSSITIDPGDYHRSEIAVQVRDACVRVRARRSLLMI